MIDMIVRFQFFKIAYDVAIDNDLADLEFCFKEWFWSLSVIRIYYDELLNKN